MNYQKSYFFFLIATSVIAYGMDQSNRHVTMISELPLELEQAIVIGALYQDDQKKTSAIPCVCTRWNAFVNSSQVIKSLPLPLVNKLKITGAKQLKINKEFGNACHDYHASLECNLAIYNENIPSHPAQEQIARKEADFESIKIMFGSPYFDISAPIVQEALKDVAFNGIPEILHLFLTHGANFNIPNKSSGYLLRAVISGIEDSNSYYPSRFKSLFTLFLGGAQDAECAALNWTLQRMNNHHAKFESAYYNMLPMLIRMVPNINKQDEKGNAPLHYLLGHASVFTAQVLTLLVKDNNANPHIKNKKNQTAYDLARELDSENNNMVLLDILRTHDKGVTWYE